MAQKATAVRMVDDDEPSALAGDPVARRGRAKAPTEGSGSTANSRRVG